MGHRRPCGRGSTPRLGSAFRLITWDMRGHGQTVCPQEQEHFTEAHTIADMTALLDHLGIERAVIGGLSLGGFMSLAFHLAHPQRTQALMLFDTGPGYRSPDARAGWNKFAKRQGDRLMDGGLDALMQGNEVDVAKHRSAEALAMAAYGMLAQFDDRVINSLPDIAVPTLVLVGDRDEQYFGPTDYMTKKIAGAQKVTIGNAGPLLQHGQPRGV